MEEEEEKEEDSQHDSNLFRPNELLHGYKRPTLAYLIMYQHTCTISALDTERTRQWSDMIMNHVCVCLVCVCTRACVCVRCACVRAMCVFACTFLTPSRGMRCRRRRRGL